MTARSAVLISAFMASDLMEFLKVSGWKRLCLIVPADFFQSGLSQAVHCPTLSDRLSPPLTKGSSWGKMPITLERHFTSLLSLSI